MSENRQTTRLTDEAYHIPNAVADATVLVCHIVLGDHGVAGHAHAHDVVGLVNPRPFVHTAHVVLTARENGQPADLADVSINPMVGQGDGVVARRLVDGGDLLGGSVPVGEGGVGVQADFQSALAGDIREHEGVLAFCKESTV